MLMQFSPLDQCYEKGTLGVICWMTLMVTGARRQQLFFLLLFRQQLWLPNVLHLTGIYNLMIHEFFELMLL